MRFHVGMKITRRSLLLWLISLAGLHCASFVQNASAQSGGTYLAYVGTYTQRGSQGIYAYRYDASTGRMTSLGLAAETKDPSFLVIHPNRKWLYLVNEGQTYKGQASGGVSAFTIDRATGKLTLLNDVASRGADPCYISLDHSGRFALVANYTGGSVAVFPVLADGRLGEASAFVQHKGSGPNHERQEGPHAHWIDLSPDNRFALTADLGLDEVLVYRFDAGTGTLAANDPAFAKVDPGAGPRHVAFAPNGKFVYVIDEISATLTSFSYEAKGGRLQRLEAVPTLPKDFAGKNTSAEIVFHPSGKFLYVSNRGHDSIALFKVDSGTGRLTFIEHTSTGGKEPRNFEIDPTGRRLFAANQESDNIVEFTIDQATGRLASTGQKLTLPAPVCIRFMAEQ